MRMFMVISKITGADENSHTTHVVSRGKVANFAEIISMKRKSTCTENILYCRDIF
jgi:hypothetical protein